MAVCEVRKTVTMSRKDQDQRPGDAGSDIVTETRPKTKKPSLYKVLLLNDDYTPMEFVVYILESFFNKSQEDATRVMLHVHQKGVGVCGVERDVFKFNPNPITRGRLTALSIPV